MKTKLFSSAVLAALIFSPVFFPVILLSCENEMFDITLGKKESGAELLAFAITDAHNKQQKALINKDEASALLKVYTTNFTPSYLLSTGALIEPVPKASDFPCADKTYTVIAEDGTRKDWSLTVLQTGELTADVSDRVLIWDFAGESLTLNQGDEVTIKVMSQDNSTIPDDEAPLTEQYDWYLWTVDTVFAGAGYSITLEYADYTPGSHTLLVNTGKDGYVYSKQLNFTVEAALEDSIESAAKE